MKNRKAKSIIAAIMIIGGLLCLSFGVKAQNTWTPNKKYIGTKKDTASYKATKYQCYGTCKDWHRCKRTVSTHGGFCYQHAAQK